MQMQMMLEIDDDARASVRSEHRVQYRIAWTAAFALVAFGIWYGGVMDPSRIGLRKTITPSQIEVVAWRLVIVVMLMPIMATGFCVYANVCCAGDFVIG